MMVDLVMAELDRVHERIAGRFARAEPRSRVREYVSGLVAGLERKNGWTLAEWAGEVSPDGMQRLLRILRVAQDPAAVSHGLMNRPR
jgi:hypothetical protein